MKNLDLMIKVRRHSCNPRAAIRLGEPGGLQPRLQIESGNLRSSLYGSSKFRGSFVKFHGQMELTILRFGCGRKGQFRLTTELT
jgi:hypothetical protein